MARNASPAQTDLITRLFAGITEAQQADPAVQALVAPHVATIIAVRNGGEVTGGEAHGAIDALLTITRLGQATGQVVKANRYPGKCGSCGHNVAEGAGRIERNAAGKWITFHLDGACSTEAPAAPAARADEAGESLVPGFYRAIDGGTWQVKAARHGGLYAMAGTILPEVKPSWEYVKGGMSNLVGAHRLTADEAAAIGHLTHHCCFCGIELTDEGEGRSVEVGYGPKCARKHGLPWG